MYENSFLFRATHSYILTERTHYSPDYFEKLLAFHLSVIILKESVARSGGSVVDVGLVLIAKRCKCHVPVPN